MFKSFVLETFRMLCTNRNNKHYPAWFECQPAHSHWQCTLYMTCSLLLMKRIAIPVALWSAIFLRLVLFLSKGFVSPKYQGYPGKVSLGLFIASLWTFPSTGGSLRHSNYFMGLDLGWHRQIIMGMHMLPVFLFCFGFWWSSVVPGCLSSVLSEVENSMT